MRVISVRHVISHLLLIVAYLACVLQWLWILIIALPPLIDNGTFDMLQMPPQPAPAVPPVASDPSPLIMMIVGSITFVIIIVSMIILIRLPRTIARTGERVVTATANTVLPTLIHHQPLPSKKKRVLSRRIKLCIQICLVLLPLVVSFFLPSPGELTDQVVRTVAGGSAVISLTGFILAWLIEPPVTSQTRLPAFHG